MRLMAVVYGVHLLEIRPINNNNILIIYDYYLTPFPNTSESQSRCLIARFTICLASILEEKE